MILGAESAAAPCRDEQVQVYEEISTLNAKNVGMIQSSTEPG